ncbi:MAG: hypothetical protein C4320_02380 [Armatimonadota bacterium]
MSPHLLTRETLNMAKATLRTLVIAATAATLVSVAGAQTFNVKLAAAPNAYGSPSYAAWQTNALDALAADASTFGDPSMPSYFQDISGQTVDAGQNIVTNFNSWKGSVAAATGDFANEYGNRFMAPVSIVYTTGFRLMDVFREFSSTDNEGANGINGVPLAHLTGIDFSTRARGLSYGADGIKGTSDDIVYNSSNPGSDSVFINELLFAGSGVAYEVLNDTTFPGNTLQEKIDNEVARLGSYSLTVTYGIDGSNLRGSTTGNLQTSAVPEPATMAVLGLGALGLLRRRNRKS